MESNGMSFRTLQYALALAETGHFAKAAAQCDVTQSTLSLQIKRLEEYLGVELFDRQARPVKPTAAGEHVLAHARQAIDACQAIRAIAAQQRGQPVNERFYASCDERAD